MSRQSTLLFLALLIISNAILAQADRLNYDLENPDETFKLPEYLSEVSALTYYGEDRLAMLNDETGSMFVYNVDLNEMSQRVRFKGNGDFEGIERIGDHIYAIESKGSLFKFKVNMEGVVEKIETPFKKSNNVEGLGYDPFKNQLLFGLKDSGDVGNFDVKGRAIYSYDLETETFLEAPSFVILKKDLERVVGKEFRFKPSGLAVHPRTGELYVLSANDRAIIVFNADGSPKNLTRLKRKNFPQPEGIAFFPDGTLFIANEVEDEGGTILKFNERDL